MSFRLAGRSERRWRSLKKHIDEFIRDVRELRSHIIESPPLPVDEFGGMVVMIPIAPAFQGVYDNFKDEYRLR